MYLVESVQIFPQHGFTFLVIVVDAHDVVVIARCFEGANKRALTP